MKLRVAGVDEVGRGPLAGPVVACAVVVPEGVILEGVGDSKKLTARRREALVEVIKEQCDWALGEASVAEIDMLNIWGATQVAMRRALAGLRGGYDAVRVDGKLKIGGVEAPQETLVGGDGLDVAIGAASILAKVYRDELMAKLAVDFPAYGWAQNAGYGTAVHLEALRMHGVTCWHRVSFEPIKSMMR